jgi:hypothetical protein
MESLKKLAAAIGSIPTVGAQSAHIALLKERLNFVLQDIEALEEENAELIKQLQERHHQIPAQPNPAQYTECRGALFKRKPSGGYDEVPRCPSCETVMNSFQNIFPYTCGNKRCGQRAAFKGNELPFVLSKLPHT